MPEIPAALEAAVWAAAEGAATPEQLALLEADRNQWLDALEACRVSRDGFSFWPRASAPTMIFSRSTSAIWRSAVSRDFIAQSPLSSDRRRSRIFCRDSSG